MTIIELEGKLSRIKLQHSSVMKILKKKGITSFYNPRVTKIIETEEPQLKPRCLDIIQEAGIHTLANGHCERTDYVKSMAFMILGKCLGQNLESW